MFGARLYDAVGGAYSATRRIEPRIAASIWAALGDARTVLNVGAGTGSYEPRDVTAVEPSAVMRAQRRAWTPSRKACRSPKCLRIIHAQIYCFRRAPLSALRPGPEDAASP